MAEFQLSTPVAFMIFNRPETTARVFEAIRQARPTMLLVVADGPRPNRPGEAEQCAAARAVIDQVDWECQVLTNYADTNLGCGHRISSGINWVFEQVEEAIILEDDCLPHVDFFPFCAALLEKYRTDERVMMVGGTNFLPNLAIPESYLFSRYFSIWGWATWRRAWALYDINMSDWETLSAQKQIAYLYSKRYLVRYFTKIFDVAYRNQVDTWDIQWFFCCLFNNGLSIVPRVNLITNIGVAGTHTIGTKGHPHFNMPTFALDDRNLRHPQRVFASAAYDPIFFERHLKISMFQRVRRKIASLKGNRQIE